MVQEPMLRTIGRKNLEISQLKYPVSANADSLLGSAGNDLYIVGQAGDVVKERAGAAQGLADTVQSSIGYTLTANVENLVLTGTSNINGTGNGAANVITGNSGDNVLSGGAGNDTLAGGVGDDTLIWDANDGSVQGGAGIDTLKINGSRVTLDLTVVSDTVHQDIEVIDLTGTGNNMLTVALADAVAISSTTDTLRVDGNAGDVVTTTDAGWFRTLNVVNGAQTYAQYTNGAATFLVDTDIGRGGIDSTVSAIALSSLNGANGLRLEGVGAYHYSGVSVSTAGDVNGDGFDDVVVGAHGANDGAGASYVVLGTDSGFASTINLSTLGGANGFRLDGVAEPHDAGISVSDAGDVNGDGLGDVIVGAYRAGDSYAGASYVVFGASSGFSAAASFSSLDGSNGFELRGVAANDRSGRAVSSAGDVNGDGFGDVIIGAFRAAPGGPYSGASYVVFGQASGLASSVNLSTLDGVSGFKLSGVAFERSGRAVSAAGDVNGDGFDDVIVGAYRSFVNGGVSGASYVVFGSSSGFASNLELSALDGVDGFRLDGAAAGDYAGTSVGGAGDVNGDGFDDLIVGARFADPNNVSGSGASYVVFGKSSGFASTVNLSTLDGANGFRLDGVAAYDESGNAVGAAGDVNGDGFDDLIVGARSADPNGADSGASYVVFGRASGFASSILLSTLDGTSGFKLSGVAADDRSGYSVSGAGDVNGDGFDDLIVGARNADPNGISKSGASYVVFGGDFTGAVTFLGTSGADSLVGTSAAETFVSGQGNDTITGGGGADVVRAAEGDDLIRVSSTAFADIDGGSGNDTLRYLGGGFTIDLTVLANNKISGIETIHLAGTGNKTLTLAMGDLLDLSDTTNQLTVDGNAGDTVNLDGSWADGGVAGAYHTYTQGAATVLVDTDIGVVFI